MSKSKLSSFEAGEQRDAGGSTQRKKSPWEAPRVTGAALRIRGTSKNIEIDEGPDIVSDNIHGPSS